MVVTLEAILMMTLFVSKLVRKAARFDRGKTWIEFKQTKSVLFLSLRICFHFWSGRPPSLYSVWLNSHYFIFLACLCLCRILGHKPQIDASGKSTNVELVQSTASSNGSPSIVFTYGNCVKFEAARTFTFYGARCWPAWLLPDLIYSLGPIYHSNHSLDVWKQLRCHTNSIRFSCVSGLLVLP